MNSEEKQINSNNPFYLFFNGHVLIGILLLMALLLTLINQIYISFSQDNESEKRRSIREWIQIGLIFIIPICVGYFVWYHQSLGPLNTEQKWIYLSFAFVLLLSFSFLAIQFYLVINEKDIKYHRRNFFDLISLFLVFLLFGASMMTIQPRF